MKTKLLITLSLLFGSILGFSQSLSSNQSPEVYAVVIGISDYQDPVIPDLRFAHRDVVEPLLHNFLSFGHDGLRGLPLADEARTITRPPARRYRARFEPARQNVRASTPAGSAVQAHGLRAAQRRERVAELPSHHGEDE